MKLRQIIVTIPLALILTACGASPDSVIQDFYMDISAGKIGDAMDLMDLDQARSIGFGQEKIKASLMAKTSDINSAKCGGLAKVTILSEEVHGDIATQKVRLTCKTKAYKTVDGKLLKGKNGWRIVIELQ